MDFLEIAEKGLQHAGSRRPWNVAAKHWVLPNVAERRVDLLPEFSYFVELVALLDLEGSIPVSAAYVA
eukprot:m.168847 g.168847  ORF g.168847 m.168847 type:complete len:68 (+) comp18222_c0_seq3:2024-2227(+)